ncbi:MAG: RimK family alpha-L-glutamate ligase [Cyanobacteriota bacterium]
MSAVNVGILGFARDPQVRAVSLELERRGATPLLLPADALNAQQPVSSWDGLTSFAGVPLAECKAIYVRSAPSPHPPVIRRDEQLVLHADWFPRYMQARERSGFLLSLLLSLEHAGVRLVNPLQAGAALRHKPFQLDVLRRLGARLPRTLISNDPAQIRDFHAAERDRQGEVIFKPLLGGAITRLLDEDVLAKLDHVRAAPVIFQQRIVGDDIRVVLVGNEVVSAAAIRTPHPHLDFRDDPCYSRGQARYEPVSLPLEIVELCRQAARACDLCFTGIDIKRTAQEEWVFLELNSSPIYLDVERKLGDPISAALAELLLASAQD